MNGGNREGGNLFERLQLSESGRGISRAPMGTPGPGEGGIWWWRRRASPPQSYVRYW